MEEKVKAIRDKIMPEIEKALKEVGEKYDVTILGVDKVGVAIDIDKHFKEKE